MTSNNIAARTNARLSRIQGLSRVLKICILFYVVLPVCIAALNLKSFSSGTFSIFNQGYGSMSDIPVVIIALWILGTGIYVFGVICFYRLLGLYEKGVIFSAANVAEMKKLGGCLVGYGLVGIAASFLGLKGAQIPWVLLEIVGSPWLMVGGTIYVVAWIMDEGRKIQEEQELTV